MSSVLHVVARVGRSYVGKSYTFMITVITLFLSTSADDISPKARESTVWEFVSDWYGENLPVLQSIVYCFGCEGGEGRLKREKGVGGEGGGM